MDDFTTFYYAELVSYFPVSSTWHFVLSKKFRDTFSDMELPLCLLFTLGQTGQQLYTLEVSSFYTYTTI